MNDDGPLRIRRARNVDVVPTRPAAIDMRVLDDQRLTVGVGDGPILDVELGAASLRGVVLQ